MLKKWLLFFVGLAVSVGACYWLAHQTEFAEVWMSLEKLGPGSLVILSLGYATGFYFRAQRSRVMMAPTPHPIAAAPAAEAIILGCAANNVLPLRLGEVVRTLYAAARTGCPRPTALAWVAAERLTDLMMLLVFLVGSIGALSLLPGDLPTVFEALWWPTLALAAALTVALFSTAWLRRLLDQFAHRLPALVVTIGHRLFDAVLFLRDPASAAKVAWLTLAVWTFEGSLFVGTAWALGLPHPFLAGFLTLSVVNLSILIPSSPGYVGVFHAAAVFALTPLGAAPEQALALALICHGLPYLLVTLTGLVIALRRPTLVFGLRKVGAGRDL